MKVITAAQGESQVTSEVLFLSDGDSGWEISEKLSAVDRRILLSASLRLLGFRLSRHIPVRQSDVARLVPLADGDDSAGVAA